MRLHKYALFILLIIICLPVACSSKNKQAPINEKQPGIVITYVGNMGVLISDTVTSVLIDGLHEFYQPAYLNPPDSVVDRIIHQQDIFAHLNMALFTHYHKDHFSAKLAKAFLDFSVDRKVAGASQVTDSVAAGQSINAWNKNGVIFSDSAAGVAIAAYNILHTWQQRHAKVQNIGYLVKLNGISVLHLGDADTDVSVFHQYKFGKVDVLITPLWFLTDKNGIRIITEIIKPGRVVVTHISPGDKDALQLHKLPGTPTEIFTSIGQSVAINNSK